MRKRISVCMLVAMMNVTSLYSFATHGAETKTEQETGIEQESEESETQTEEAVDPMSADRLLMRIRVFSPEEVLDAYFGKGKWNEDLITEQSTLASERYIYDGEKQQVLVVTDNTVYESIAITYKDDVPDEESMLKEWEQLLQTLNINIMDEYIKQVDYLNGDRATYTYYLQQDGIKLSPEGYAIGKEGNEKYGFIDKTGKMKQNILVSL